MRKFPKWVTTGTEVMIKGDDVRRKIRWIHATGYWVAVEGFTGQFQKEHVTLIKPAKASPGRPSKGARTRTHVLLSENEINVAFGLCRKNGTKENISEGVRLALDIADKRLGVNSVDVSHEISAIARQVLRVPTLVQRDSEGDVYSCSVVDLHTALEMAYQQGRAAGS